MISSSEKCRAKHVADPPRRIWTWLKWVIGPGILVWLYCQNAQALAQSSAHKRVQMGTALTQGLGAGSQPQIGAAAAEEALPEILDHLAGAHMAFITAGMGGGTGTGAAPVIARAVWEARCHFSKSPHTTRRGVAGYLGWREDARRRDEGVGLAAEATACYGLAGGVPAARCS